VVTAKEKKTVMVVAGEASGDMHGAGLVRAMRARNPGLDFCGMGGSELAAAGVEILFDAARIAVVGITEVFSHLGDILKARRILVERLRKSPPSLLVLIDYPDFNLLLGKTAKRLGIPILYYISPQVWAWRSGRAAKIAAIADRIAVILPFEKDFYGRRGIEVDFVGHPLMDMVTTSVDTKTYLKKLSVPPGSRVIGLLPGSRRKEISSLLPVFLEAAVQLSSRSSHRFVFLLPRASTVSMTMLEESGLGECGNTLDVRVVSESRYDMMAACDAVVAASGTVTLELAILGIPMVAAYRISPRTYRLGRLLISLPHMTLVNLVAGRQVVPELIQDEVTAENIATLIATFLSDDRVRRKMRRQLCVVKGRLGRPGAADRTARLACGMLSGKGVGSPILPGDRS